MWSVDQDTILCKHVEAINEHVKVSTEEESLHYGRNGRRSHREALHEYNVSDQKREESFPLKGAAYRTC